MRMFWGDYFRDTRGLNRHEHSAYLILLGQPGHALNIMLPGSLVGLIVGYAAQTHQSTGAQHRAAL